MALIYTVVLVVVLMAFVSLGVDLGRVQLAKTELQGAADAAARYGAAGIDDGTAISKALVAAADNLVDGSPLVLNNNIANNPRDVEVGNWDNTLDPKFSTTRTPNNAVRVTARRTASRGTAIPLLFARVLGANTCDVTATSVATKGSDMPNFIGLDDLTGRNNTSAGYDPRLGLPGASLSSGASIASNGDIALGNNPAISGSVILGPNGTYNGSNPKPTKLSNDLVYPPTENPPVVAGGALNVDGVVHISGGGTLAYSSINMASGAWLIFDNPTTVYVMNDITFNGGGSIAPASGLPSDLRIRIIGSSTSTVGGSNSNDITITAQVYAPNTDLIGKNNAELRGTSLFRTITVKNNLFLYYDITHKSVVDGLGEGAGGIVTVQ
jgi:Flp pilus assembly protein TadG